MNMKENLRHISIKDVQDYEKYVKFLQTVFEHVFK